jgi:FkbM family methyltransferase
MAASRVDLVVDVGANSGQYASGLRAAGYRGRIVSFEPLSEPYGRLAAASSEDGNWECRQLALGRRSGSATIHVSEDSRNSSIFAVGDRHLQAVPDSRPVGAETVRIERLDDLWPAIVQDAQCPYLKMDTQGSELDVLCGATRMLDAIALVEVELSLVAVYDSAPVFADVHRLLARHGFAPIAFEGVLDDIETGEMLQADGIFRRGTGSSLASTEIR